MSKRIFIGMLVMVFALAGTGLLTGCAKKEVRTDMPTPAAGKAGKASAPSSALTEAQLKEQKLKEELAKKRMMFLNEMVHFDFDKSDIRVDAAEVLKRKAAWLKENPNVVVIIQGHCDERGTEAYNMALGERRAQAAKKFLMALGISGDRLETISYGEEMPLDPGHNEEAWAKNRRAQFVIK